MAEKKNLNENYDALDSWREEIYRYAGGSEHDSLVESILAYERAKKAKEQARKQDEMEKDR